jgi:predicted CopG family antitoxin
MGKYATISVPTEVKARLEKIKGDKEWGDFLMEMCTEGQRLKGEKAFEELRQLLTKEDREAIRKSSREFRENFKLR